MANLERHTPATPKTAFEIGSITKQFTAAAILLLAQEGKLTVDDKISRYLKGTPASWGGISIRHLLTHTSGLKNYTGLDGFELARHLTQAQFISQIAAHPLDFAPGEKWSYCNTGYNLLGYIIENVSGKSYWDFLEQNIFAPLGMTATAPREPRATPPFARQRLRNQPGRPVHQPRPRSDGCFFRRRAGLDRGRPGQMERRAGHG